jgi:hypothetical protein
MNKHCLLQFRAHWQCLDNNNHQLWQCRPYEMNLNKCVFDNLVRFTKPYSLTITQAPVFRDGLAVMCAYGSR